MTDDSIYYFAFSRKRYFNKEVKHVKNRFIRILNGLLVAMCLLSSAAYGQGEPEGAGAAVSPPLNHPVQHKYTTRSTNTGS